MPTEVTFTVALPSYIDILVAPDEFYSKTCHDYEHKRHLYIYNFFLQSIP